MEHAIPANVFIRIDEADLPPGPTGASAYDAWLSEGHTGTVADFLDWLRDGAPSIVAGGVVMGHASLAPGASTGSFSAYVATGLSCAIEVPAGKRVRIECHASVNHTQQNFVHFTLKRNGVDLTPASHTGLAAVRIDIADGVRDMKIDHFDTPGEGTATYELWWRCHNAGTAYLGRRPIDTAFMVPTTMTLTLVDA